MDRDIYFGARWGTPEQLYMALLEVGWCARRQKMHDLARSMRKAAHNMLEVWRQDERTAKRFAARVLSGPTNLRVVTAQLPQPVAEACFKLISLLEYLASLDERSNKDLATMAQDGAHWTTFFRSIREAAEASQSDD